VCVDGLGAEGGAHARPDSDQPSRTAEHRQV